MNTHFSIKSDSVHLWRIVISDFFEGVVPFQKILSPDELERFNRYKSPRDQKSFLVTRGILREVLSLYTYFSPEKIQFQYGHHGKPSLKENGLQFNISHSDNMAVFALANTNIGIDIQKKKAPINDAVAKRFFTENEFELLISLNEDEKIKKFYELWSEKEATIKLFGEGIFALEKSKENSPAVEHVFVHPNYEMALATTEKIQYFEFYEWTQAGPRKIPNFTC